MKRPLSQDLIRHSKLAFRRMRPGRELIERFHKLPKQIRNEWYTKRAREWLLVPFSLWPVDIIGLSCQLFESAESNAKPSAKLLALLELLGDAPSTKACSAIGTYEHRVKGGNYESLIKAQHKFDFKEESLMRNPGFVADWNWIKTHFDVSKHRGDTGIIRRRMVAERNFHPPEWDFRWRSAVDQFLNVFDAFCHKWVLYGMERDKPLLQKLSVNITPYGTMIVIPRYWSFDGYRDLRWRAITQLHHSRGVTKQGLKLASNQKERRKQAEMARAAFAEATQLGIRGEKRDDLIIARLGLRPETDRKQLSRLLRLY